MAHTKLVRIDLKKQCVICHAKINFNKDRYINLRDYIGKEMTDECFYHLECWKDKFRIQQQKAIEEFVKPMMNTLKNNMQNMQGVQTF